MNWILRRSMLLFFLLYASFSTMAFASAPIYFNVQDRMIEVNGLNFHLVDYGGQGKTVFLLHGLTANARYWDAVAERLVDQYHVVAIDIRGRGDSDKPQNGYYDQWQYAQDVKDVLDSLKIDKVILAGHSMGAQVGVIFANQYPERIFSLILVDGGLGFSPDQRDKIYKALKPAFARLGKPYPDFQTYLKEAKEGPYYKDGWNKYIARYYWYDVFYQTDGTVVPKTAKHAIIPAVKGRPFDMDKLNSGIKVPVLLLQSPQGFIVGEESIPLVVPEKGRQFIAGMAVGSKYVTIETANHYNIVLTKYDQVVREIQSFLEAIP